MINMKHNLRRHILQAAFTLVGAATLGLVAAGGTASADDYPIHPVVSFTATINGAQKTLSQDNTAFANSDDMFSKPVTATVNVDKASNITEHLDITNNSASTQQVYDFLTLPGGYEADPNQHAQGESLISDSKPSLAQFAGGTFFLGYNYGNGPQPIFDGSKHAQGIYIGQDLSLPGGYSGPQALPATQKVSLSVPLRLSPDYNFDANPAQTAQSSNSFYYRGSDGGVVPMYSAFFKLTMVHAITAQDFTAQNYASLNNSQTLGVKSLYDADGNQVDVKNATVKSITPTNDPSKYTVVYSYDGVPSKPVTATITDQTFIDAKDFTVNYGSNWDSQKFNGLTKHLDQNGQAVTKLSDGVNVTIQLNGKTVNAVDTNNAGAVYDVTYTAGDNAASKTVKVTVGQRGNIPSNNNSNNNNSTTNNNGNSGNSAWNPSNPSNPNGTGLPNYAAVKGSAVYATKGIYMYRSVNFTKSQRTATYPKAKRVNRPMFVVLGYDKSNGGALRYKVRDVNHGKKTAGKIGYITTNPKYVVNVYYKTMPKSHKITVINKKGIHAYKNVNLTGRAKTFKKGTHVTVKSFEKHNLTTRYKLSNGTYITANKKLVIQGNY